MISMKNLAFLSLLTLILMSMLTLTTASAQEMVWSPDGTLIASGSEDGTVRVWNPSAGGEPLYVLKDHTDAIRALAWSPNGQTLASRSYDGTIRLWDSKSGEHKVTLMDPGAAAKRISRDSKPIVSAAPVTVMIEKVPPKSNETLYGGYKDAFYRLKVNSTLQSDIVVRVKRESVERYVEQGQSASGLPTRENKVVPGKSQESYVHIPKSSGVSKTIAFLYGPYAEVKITILPMPNPPPELPLKGIDVNNGVPYGNVKILEDQPVLSIDVKSIVPYIVGTPAVISETGSRYRLKRLGSSKSRSTRPRFDPNTFNPFE